MSEAEDEFCGLVEAVLRRFLRQNAQAAVAEKQVAGIAARLQALVEQRGLPRPLARHEIGAPGGMSEDECAPLVLRVLGEAGNGSSLLADAVRQLVKACFYPEFKVCRDSFCEADGSGVCRRQEPGRAQKRVSGSHCVDCPHWVALSAEQHREFLARQWRAGAEAFAASRDVFLPEDFRALRRWLHTRARKAE
ncbi:MAG: hypothetical protein ABIZ49_00015 [Opitutaceae bacterium]